jgi:hypothetical protein
VALTTPSRSTRAAYPGAIDAKRFLVPEFFGNVSPFKSQSCPQGIVGSDWGVAICYGRPQRTLRELPSRASS